MTDQEKLDVILESLETKTLKTPDTIYTIRWNVNVPAGLDVIEESGGNLVLKYSENTLTESPVFSENMGKAVDYGFLSLATFMLVVLAISFITALSFKFFRKFL